MSKLWKCHVRATEDTGQWIGLTRGRIRWIFPSRVIPISNDKRASSDRLICWRGRQGRTDLPKVKQILQVSETCFGGDPRQFDKRVQRWLHRHRQLSGIAVLGDSLCGPRRREHSSPYPLDNRERSEEHTSELQSLTNVVCRHLLEKKNCGGQQGRLN